MTADPDWTLLDRYWSGECAPNEAKAIDDWMRLDVSHAQVLVSMHRVWTEAANPLLVLDEGVAWLALRERIAASPRNVPATRAKLVVMPSLMLPRARRVTWRTRAFAAGIAMTVGIGAIGWWQHAGGDRGSAAEPFREYVTARGQRAEVTLIDGTRVWLSVDSRLRVPRSYGTVARDLDLSGEAFFIVQHDARRPFRVRAGRGVSEDLGTEFDMRAYPGDPGAVVIVSAGRVALRPAAMPAGRGHDTALTRGQMGRLNRSGAVEVVNDVDLDASLAWRNGRLEFEDRPLANVVRELERWYDIEITIDDSSLASVPITASFSNQSADQALAIVASTLGVHYTRTGRHVRIRAMSGAH